MRPSRRRRVTTCTACEAPLPRDASWCGSCGERVGTARPGPEDDDAAVVTQQDAGAQPGGTSAAGRRVAAGAVLLGVGVAAVVGFGGVTGTTGETLLGTVGQRANVSSTAPPPEGLRLAWAREVFSGDRFGYDPTEIGRVVARDGRATLGSLVVDVASGAVLGAMDPYIELAGAGAQGVSLSRDGSALVFSDRLTGDWLREVEVDLQGPEGRLGGVHRHAGGVTLVSRSVELGAGGLSEISLLVTDDGAVVAELGAVSVAYRSRVQRDEPYVVLEEGPGASTSTVLSTGPDTSVVLDMRTGERVLEVVHPLQDTTIDVADGLALVARATDGRIVQGVGFAWEVEVVELDSGEVLGALQLDSGDAPTLVGRLSDGSPVVGLRRGSEVVASAVGPSGLVGPEVVVRARQQGLFSGESPGLRVSAQQLALLDDVLIVADAGGGGAAEVRAQTLDGRPRWRAPVGDLGAISAGDGFVAISEGREGDIDGRTRLRLLRLEDGVQVASVTPDGGGLTLRPVLADDGVVGTAVEAPYTGRMWELTSQLQWTRVLDGAALTSVDVVRPWVTARLAGGAATPPAGPEADDATEEAQDLLRDLSGAIHGFVPNVDGPARPLVSRNRVPQTLEVLEQDGSWTLLEAEPDHDEQQGGEADISDEPYSFYHEPVDADGERLLAYVQAFDGDGDAIVLDLDGEDQRRIRDLYPIGLVEGLVLGYQATGSYLDVRLAAFDAATGQQRWAVDVDGLGFSRPLVDRNGLVFGDGFAITAIGIDGGGLTWRWASDDLLLRTMGMSARHVFVRTAFGEVVAIDRDTGEEAWRVELGVGLPEASTVAGGHLLVGNRDGDVVHLDDEGREVQRIRASAEPIEGLAVVDGTVVATTEHRVLGLRRDGRGLTERDQVDLP